MRNLGSDWRTAAALVCLKSPASSRSLIVCQLLGFPRVAVAGDLGECRGLPIERPEPVCVALVWNGRNSDLVWGD